jgi:hypothetical protein
MIDAGEFRFLEQGELGDDRLTLQLVARQPADPARNWVPYYVFHIVSAKTGRRAGEIRLRTCEFAGAELVEIVDLPPDVGMYQEGDRQKCRFRLRIHFGGDVENAAGAPTNQ